MYYWAFAALYAVVGRFAQVMFMDIHRHLLIFEDTHVSCIHRFAHVDDVHEYCRLSIGHQFIGSGRFAVGRCLRMSSIPSINILDVRNICLRPICTDGPWMFSMRFINTLIRFVNTCGSGIPRAGCDGQQLVDRGPHPDAVGLTVQGTLAYRLPAMRH